MTAPFRGFEPYDEGAADSFHGRSEETARLARLCSGESRVIVLSGAAGAGKTSLLRAGLIPALIRRGGRAVLVGSYRRPSSRWKFCTMACSRSENAFADRSLKRKR